MKKDHKDYKKIYLGSSDRASLVLDGFSLDHQRVLSFLNFGEDGNYSAYFVDEDCIIPDYYKLRNIFYCSYLRIYDDDSLRCELHCDWTECFKIFRAGDFGCIIQKVFDYGRYEKIKGYSVYKFKENLKK